MDNEKMEFQPTIYDVYARTDNKGRVTKIFSSCFEQPKLDDFLIKSGSGDEYVHVGYYNIYNEDSTYKYKIEDWQLKERTLEERQEDLRGSNISSEIDALKKKLADTDYQAIKYSEGLISEEEYADMRSQRIAWRDEINRLEAERASLIE